MIMMILTGARDESQVYVMDDGSEIEVVVVKPEGEKIKILN